MAYPSGTLTTPLVTDVQGGSYTLIADGDSSLATGIYLWVFRRAGPVIKTSTTFTVTVTPEPISSKPIMVLAIEVLNDGGIDVPGSVAVNSSSTSESSSVTSTENNDLVLFLGADAGSTSHSYSGGLTHIPGYTSSPTGVSIWGAYQDLVSPATASSTRTVTPSLAWVSVSIAISPQVAWSGIAGKPYVTVSPIGVVTSPASLLVNNGADFGPDTYDTKTSGIQEALNSIATSGGTVYCTAGTYVLQAPIGNTGSYQTVVFEAGCEITGLYADLSPGGVPTEALVWVAQNVASGPDAASAAYSQIQWIGNGCVINLLDASSGNYILINNVFEYTVKGPLNSGISPQATLVTVDNFEITNLSGNVLWFETDNGGGSHPNITQQASVWKISRICANTWNSNSPTSGVPQPIGICGVRLFHLDQLYIDGSTIPTACHHSLIRIWSEGGDTSDIRVTGSVFLGNTDSGSQIAEVQGSTTSVGGEITSRVQFEGCVFQQPNTIYNVLLDDSAAITQTNQAFVTDFEFKACEFSGVGVTLLPGRTGSSYFGYGRFVDCRFKGLSVGASPFSGSLLGRGPAASGTSLTIPSTPDPAVYTNNDGFDETIVISGTNVNGPIKRNGVNTGLISGSFFLRTGDYVTIPFTTGTPPPSGSVVVIPE
ncbi:MAG: hypothetical protein L3K02_00705 [Thermoplasmata archaeon]|nr:hypothetical protein [Thermoplasmata archaeon]